MNDNKKWAKRAGVLFWWFIACLPLIYLVFTWLVYIFYANSDNGSITVLSNSVNDMVTTFSTIVIYDLFTSLNRFLVLIGIHESVSLAAISIPLTWFIQTWLIHLAVDFVLILPKVCQKLIEKVCD